MNKPNDFMLTLRCGSPYRQLPAMRIARYEIGEIAEVDPAAAFGGAKIIDVSVHELPAETERVFCRRCRKRYRTNSGSCWESSPAASWSCHPCS